MLKIDSFSRIYTFLEDRNDRVNNSLLLLCRFHLSTRTAKMKIGSVNATSSEVEGGNSRRKVTFSHRFSVDRSVPKLIDRNASSGKVRLVQLRYMVERGSERCKEVQLVC